MSPWLKVAEAGEYTKLSPDVIRAAIKAGDLPAYAPTPGRKDIRLKTSDLDEWIEGQPYVPAGRSV